MKLVVPRLIPKMLWILVFILNVPESAAQSKFFLHFPTTFPNQKNQCWNLSQRQVTAIPIVLKYDLEIKKRTRDRSYENRMQFILAVCQNLDLVFVVDVSSFNQQNLQVYQQFIRDVSNQVAVFPGGTHVAIVEYADGAYTRLFLSRGTSLQEISNVLPSLGRTPEQGNNGISDRQVVRGLDMVLGIWNNPSENRQNYPNAMIYITAGYPFNQNLVAQLRDVQDRANNIKNGQQVVSNDELGFLWKWFWNSEQRTILISYDENTGYWELTFLSECLSHFILMQLCANTNVSNHVQK